MSVPIAPGHLRSPHSLQAAQRDPRDGVTPSQRVRRVDPSKVDPKMREAAQEMEAMFMDYLMKSMRDSIPESEGMMAPSHAEKVYQGMLDSEYSQKAVKLGGMGLANQLIEHWMGQSGATEVDRRIERRPEAPDDAAVEVTKN